jgi:hypothetical protein
MGESIADWIMDISSGHLLRNSTNENELTTLRSPSVQKMVPMKLQGDSADWSRDFLFNSWRKHVDGMSPDQNHPPEPFQLPVIRKKPTFSRQVLLHLQRIFISE